MFKISRILKYSLEGGKCIRSFLVKHIMNEYSVEDIERFRFWFEIIFHTEAFDTLETIFPRTLQKLFLIRFSPLFLRFKNTPRTLFKF